MTASIVACPPVPFTPADNDEFDQLVTEIAQTEGVSFREARSIALEMADDLTVFALTWDLDATTYAVLRCAA